MSDDSLVTLLDVIKLKLDEYNITMDDNGLNTVKPELVKNSEHIENSKLSKNNTTIIDNNITIYNVFENSITKALKDISKGVHQDTFQYLTIANFLIDAARDGYSYIEIQSILKKVNFENIIIEIIEPDIQELQPALFYDTHSMKEDNVKETYSKINKDIYEFIDNFTSNPNDRTFFNPTIMQEYKPVKKFNFNKLALEKAQDFKDYYSTFDNSGNNDHNVDKPKKVNDNSAIIDNIIAKLSDNNTEHRQLDNNKKGDMVDTTFVEIQKGDTSILQIDSIKFSNFITGLTKELNKQVR